MQQTPAQTTVATHAGIDGVARRRDVLFAMPRPSRRFLPVWRRNYLVWRKYLFERVLSNIIEPLITLVAFGYGLGSLLPEVGGATYLQFLASGSICMSVMYSAEFERRHRAGRGGVGRDQGSRDRTGDAACDLGSGRRAFAARAACVAGAVP